MKFPLGRLDDIADGASKEYRVATGDSIHEFFVVRRGRALFAYTNSCPHHGTPLNIWHDRMLSRTNAEIMCFTHGALFEIDTGRCVRGPCLGDYLIQVKVVIEGDELVFDDLDRAPATGFS
jgi:nitrite reductase/ring-hydroxylating ferredoxin subunit